MAITDWPLQERPRERLFALGAGSLADAELLAILLRTGVKGKSAVDVARQLLGRFGSVAALLEAGSGSLAETPGLGSAKLAQLQAALELARRALLAAGGARLSAPRARRARTGSLRRAAPRRAAPRDSVGRAFPRHAHADQRLSARGREVRAQAQRRRRDLRAQPPFRRRRAQPRRRDPHAIAESRARARRHPGARPFHRRRVAHHVVCRARPAVVYRLIAGPRSLYNPSLSRRSIPWHASAK